MSITTTSFSFSLVNNGEPIAITASGLVYSMEPFIFNENRGIYIANEHASAQAVVETMAETADRLGAVSSPFTSPNHPVLTLLR